MSSLRKSLSTALALLAFSATMAATAEDPAQVAADRYLEYLALVPQAESLEELVPYHAAWWSERKMGGSEDEKQATLAKEKEDVAKHEAVEVVEAIGSEKKVTLRLSATWQGHPMNGKVSMVHEDGDWRIDEEFWATGAAD